MLADQLDYIVGVDPHRDAHALAVVHVLSGAVVLEATVAASSDGSSRAPLCRRARQFRRRRLATSGGSRPLP